MPQPGVRYEPVSCHRRKLRQNLRRAEQAIHHGHLHALVTRLTPDELAHDLATSKGLIESELGPDAPPPVFAYPAGFCDGPTCKAVQDTGYELAFGGGRGIDPLPLPWPMALSRIPVHQYATALFRAQLRPSVARLGSMLVDGPTRRNAA